VEETPYFAPAWIELYPALQPISSSFPPESSAKGIAASTRLNLCNGRSLNGVSRLKSFVETPLLKSTQISHGSQFFSRSRSSPGEEKFAASECGLPFLFRRSITGRSKATGTFTFKSSGSNGLKRTYIASSKPPYALLVSTRNSLSFFKDFCVFLSNNMIRIEVAQKTRFCIGKNSVSE